VPVTASRIRRASDILNPTVLKRPAIANDVMASHHQHNGRRGQSVTRVARSPDRPRRSSRVRASAASRSLQGGFGIGGRADRSFDASIQNAAGGLHREACASRAKRAAQSASWRANRTSAEGPFCSLATCQRAVDSASEIRFLLNAGRRGCPPSWWTMPGFRVGSGQGHGCVRLQQTATGKLTRTFGREDANVATGPKPLEMPSKTVSQSGVCMFGRQNPQNPSSRMHRLCRRMSDKARSRAIMGRWFSTHKPSWEYGLSTNPANRAPRAPRSSVPASALGLGAAASPQSLSPWVSR